jgi:hypothetical protein
MYRQELHDSDSGEMQYREFKRIIDSFWGEIWIHDCRKWALSNSFCYDMKYKALVRWRRGQRQSPHSAPALSDNDVLPVRGLSYLGGATAAGVKPPWVFMAIEPQVPMDKVRASAPRLFSFGSWICKNGRVGKIVKRRVGEPVRESGQMVNALASWGSSAANCILGILNWST